MAGTSGGLWWVAWEDPRGPARRIPYHGMPRIPASRGTGYHVRIRRPDLTSPDIPHRRAIAYESRPLALVMQPTAGRAQRDEIRGLVGAALRARRLVMDLQETGSPAPRRPAWSAWRVRRAYRPRRRSSAAPCRRDPVRVRRCSSPRTGGRHGRGRGSAPAPQRSASPATRRSDARNLEAPGGPARGHAVPVPRRPAARDLEAPGGSYQRSRLSPPLTIRPGPGSPTCPSTR